MRTIDSYEERYRSFGPLRRSPYVLWPLFFGVNSSQRKGGPWSHPRRAACTASAGRLEGLAEGLWRANPVHPFLLDQFRCAHSEPEIAVKRVWWDRGLPGNLALQAMILANPFGVPI